MIGLVKAKTAEAGPLGAAYGDHFKDLHVSIS